MAKEINDKEFESILENEKGMFMVDLWADWCMPCKAIEPFLYDAEKELGIKLYKLNVDENPQTPSRYGVLSIPTVLCFKDGKLVGKVVGAKPKNKLFEELRRIFGL